MSRNLYVPDNLNLDSLIENNFPAIGEAIHYGITKDNLAYIIDLIVRKREFYKKINSWEFINLKAAYLKNILGDDYVNCIKFLKENGIIECDGIIKKGEKSLGYRIALPFRGSNILEVEPSFDIKQKLNRFRLKELDANPVLKSLYASRTHLIQTLKSEAFSIDIKSAFRELETNYKTKMYIRHQSKATYSGEDAAEVEAEINSAISLHKKNIEKLYTKSFEPVIDIAGQRLHSPITNMHKILRKFLTFKGEPLVSLDLKNSQPYLSLLTLNKKFYKYNNNKTLKYFDFEYYINLFHTHTPYKILDLVESLENIDDVTLYNYIEDAKNGVIYDRFLEVQPNDEFYEELRSEIKGDFFTCMFDKGYRMKFYEEFYEAYKLPFQLFEALKSVKGKYFKYKNGEKVDMGHGRLAVLLQRIESNLILDEICKKIYRTDKNIPLITVHDSIATLSQYKDFVKKTIEEELTEVIGFPPRIKEENWIP